MYKRIISYLRYNDLMANALVLISIIIFILIWIL
ncbi:hypothetical protein V518_0706 [Thermoanaerobacterium aotearoense SCUT27]|uniref:Uncharacterized protein n=3 Tax=Thermoanaerobacterium TaxID=28895 RepID=L0INQ6_THETR|nr:hypothetical protein Tsac_2801 [Thermoanaerobacterium saccharolyticum JW/SL-YS485]AGB20384.1 hypothetical protein Thethe_02833 [Thermoanaerobacterium thermosaccharolyticum M0795]ETO39118.1 hypothetical protein V518_0706 [Thermoanaerobacterium aotearoense SCUT27]